MRKVVTSVEPMVMVDSHLSIAASGCAAYVYVRRNS